MQFARSIGAAPSLTLAMEKFADASGLPQSGDSLDVMRARAFRHYAEGIRQHVVILLADTEGAAHVLKELRASLRLWSPERLTAPPSLRAHLYREARALAKKYAERRGASPATLSHLPWRPLSAATVRDYVESVEKLRTELAQADREILELRHARELTVEELGCLLDLKEGEVDQRIREAEAKAEAIVGADVENRRSGIRGAVLEAFALVQENVVFDDDTDDRPALIKSTLIGDRYTIVQRVGVGAFSDVYRAVDAEVPGHVVALKLLHQPSVTEKAKETALRELLLIASVFHPSVVQFKDHGWYEQRLWFVMPWYEGETLETRIARKPLTPREARRIFEPLARALATLHAAGIRHQDIKPDNIFLARIEGFGVEDQGNNVLPVLLDLGVAAREAEVLIAGTPMYFAPEVAARFCQRPDAPFIGKNADVFALALSLRNSLEPQSEEDVPSGAVEAFIEYRASTMPAMPRSPMLKYLESYFKRWLSLDPNERPTAEAFAKELAILTAPEETRARVMSVARWLVPLAVGLAVAFAAVVFALYKQTTYEHLEAQRARLEAKGTKAVLTVEQARRKALEEDKSDLMERHRMDQLSREQLASELSTASKQIRILARSLSATEQKRNQLLDTVATQQGQLQRLNEDVARTRAELGTERARLADVSSQLGDVQGQLGAAKDALGQAQTHARKIYSDLEASRAELTTEEQKSAELRARMAGLEAERDRLKAELGRAIERAQRGAQHGQRSPD